MNDSGAEFMLSEKFIFFESTRLALKANHKIDIEDEAENLGELFTLRKLFLTSFTNEKSKSRGKRKVHGEFLIILLH
jgi:hypothetical protein